MRLAEHDGPPVADPDATHATPRRPFGPYSPAANRVVSDSWPAARADLLCQPNSSALARSAASIAGETSTATTRRQWGAAASAKVPVPAPRSTRTLRLSKPRLRRSATSSLGSVAALRL